jgi:DNA-binding NarL/FixJ family response regulator
LFHVLVVDDFASWRKFVVTALQKQPELLVIGDASDGLQAVHKAKELQPDLILLDIGLTTLNGIEAARQIRRLCPSSRILFVSSDGSAEIVDEALGAGGSGFVLKSDAGRDLVPAIRAVLGGERFVSSSLSVNHLNNATCTQTSAHPHRDQVSIFTPSRRAAARRHEVILYSEDRDFSETVTRFIGTALKAGDAAIVVATEAHIDKLLPSLQAYGVNMDTIIEQGRYLTVDAAKAISEFVIDDEVDSARFMNAFGDLISMAARAADGGRRHVSCFGEGTQLLRAQGKLNAAIQDEQLCNQLIEIYDVDIMCAYPLRGLEDPMFQQICAVHTAVHSQ